VVALAFAFASSDRLGSFASTYALWNDAVKKLPDVPVLGAARVHTNLGAQHMERGDLAAAIADFTQALRADPDYKGALKGRAYAYLKQGKFEAAFAEVATLIRLYPDDRGSYIARGHIYKARGDLGHANADFQYGCQKMRFPGVCVAFQSRDSAQRSLVPRTVGD
jgi:Tfp pilus assembly protein PilF